MSWKFLESLVGFLSKRAQQSTKREYAEFLAAQTNLESLKKSGASSDKIAAAEKHLRNVACGVCDGGPLHGLPVSRAQTKQGGRYLIVPRFSQDNKDLCVYERSTDSPTYRFLHVFKDESEYQKWLQQHPQEYFK